MTQKKLTPQQFLKLHPGKYVMVTYEFGDPIYIAPLKNMEIQVTTMQSNAEVWSEMDNSPIKLDYHRMATGLKQLVFQKLQAEQ